MSSFTPNIFPEIEIDVDKTQIIELELTRREIIIPKLVNQLNDGYSAGPTFSNFIGLSFDNNQWGWEYRKLVKAM